MNFGFGWPTQWEQKGYAYQKKCNYQSENLPNVKSKVDGKCIENGNCNMGSFHLNIIKIIWETFSHKK